MTTSSPPAAAAGRRTRQPPAWLPWLVGVTSAGLVALSFLQKTPCLDNETLKDGTPNPDYRSLRLMFACYTDIQSLWNGRELGLHVFPYLTGSFLPDPARIAGGTVEYPVLTGLFMWLAGLPATDARGFMLVTLAVFVPVAALIGFLLARLAGWRSLLWGLTPPLVFYSMYNWDLLPVLFTVLGITVMLTAPPSRSPTVCAVVAALLFGVGGALKLYPLMFVLPLIFWVIRERMLRPPRSGARRAAFGSAAAVAVAGFGVFLACNLPFMLLGFPGWLAAFQFQASRAIDLSTMSIWAWGFLPYSSPANANMQAVLQLASTAATACGILATVLIGWFRSRGGPFPWLAVSAAMLCAYMLFNKVHSPQYVLWLLPLLVLSRLRVRWIVAYLLADVLTFVGWYGALAYDLHDIPFAESWAGQWLIVGIWARAGLLVALAILFLRQGSESGGSGSGLLQEFPAVGGDLPAFRRDVDDDRLIDPRGIADELGRVDRISP